MLKYKLQSHLSFILYGFIRIVFLPLNCLCTRQHTVLPYNPLCVEWNILFSECLCPRMAQGSQSSSRIRLNPAAKPLKHHNVAKRASALKPNIHRSGFTSASGAWFLMRGLPACGIYIPHEHVIFISDVTICGASGVKECSSWRHKVQCFSLENISLKSF